MKSKSGPFLFLKTVDLYIIKKFLGTFFFSILLLLFIIIVFDVSEKIDDFLKHDAPLREILFNYYLNFIPFFVNQFSFLFVFISVIFFTSKMASDTEIIAILSSGISFRRMLLPYFVAASLLAVMSFLLSNFLIPYTNQSRLAFEKKYVKNPKQFTDMNIHKQVSPGVYIYMENFNVPNKEGWRFTLEEIKERNLTYKITATKAKYDSVKNTWALENYAARRIAGDKESIRTGIRMDTTLPLVPADFMEDIEDVAIMNYFTLHQHILKKELRGDPDLVRYQVKMYERFASPFATLILTLIAVSVSSRKVRGGIGFNLGLGLALTFLFILFMQVFTVFATFGDLPPMLAVWIPNIIFTFIALFLARNAPK